MSSALSRLLATVESYPKVDASGFSTLQSQIEGTENRIAVARRDYVIAVKNYNTRIEKFPGAVIAGFFNFKSLPEYQAPAATREVPKIDFTKKS
jgi:LemA protein